MLKQVIFDFDGTIADSDDLTIQIINKLAVKYGFGRFPEQKLRSMNKIPMKKRFKELGIPIYRYPQLVGDFLSIYRHEVGSLKAFEGIDQMLEDLMNMDITISIMSSNNVDIINAFLLKNEMTVFESVLSSNSLFGKHKAIKKYLRQHNLNNNEVIYVADELRDIEACRKIPVRIISVLWGYDSGELIRGGNPDYIAEKPEDITKIAAELINKENIFM